jgi:hypothetical protein
VLGALTRASVLALPAAEQGPVGFIVIGPPPGRSLRGKAEPPTPGIDVIPDLGGCGGCG